MDYYNTKKRFLNLSTLTKGIIALPEILPKALRSKQSDF
jgi:hypothetical protein